MPKVLVTLSQEALDILDRETGKRGRSSYLDGLVLDTLGKRKAAPKVETPIADPLDVLDEPKPPEKVRDVTFAPRPRGFDPVTGKAIY